MFAADSPTLANVLAVTAANGFVDMPSVCSVKQTAKEHRAFVCETPVTELWRVLRACPFRFLHDDSSGMWMTRAFFVRQRDAEIRASWPQQFRNLEEWRAWKFDQVTITHAETVEWCKALLRTVNVIGTLPFNAVKKEMMVIVLSLLVVAYFRGIRSCLSRPNHILGRVMHNWCAKCSEDKGCVLKFWRRFWWMMSSWHKKALQRQDMFFLRFDNQFVDMHNDPYVPNIRAPEIWIKYMIGALVRIKTYAPAMMDAEIIVETLMDPEVFHPNDIAETSSKALWAQLYIRACAVDFFLRHCDGLFDSANTSVNVFDVLLGVIQRRSALDLVRILFPQANLDCWPAILELDPEDCDVPYHTVGDPEEEEEERQELAELREFYTQTRMHTAVDDYVLLQQQEPAV